MKYTYQDQEYLFERYPVSSNRSLRPVSAADELLLSFHQENPVADVLIQHDRFGIIANCLHQSKPVFVGTFASQEKALKLNLKANNLNESAIEIISPLEQSEKSADLVLMRLPKSLDLFDLYLSQAVHSSKPGTRIVIGFMTRNFTPAILKIADKYATEVNQSRARKKARLLVLSGIKSKAVPTPGKLIKTISYLATDFRQFYGVFSAKNIDYATQYLLPFLTPPETAIAPDAQLKLLDIGCGNGIIGHWLLRYYPNSLLSVTDDSALAIASSRLNLNNDHTNFIYSDSLDQLADDSQDLVVSNPPFHFGHENNIEVSISLFKQVRRILKSGGKFYVVANRHLNYRTHLEPLFSRVVTKGEGDKFIVYEIS